MLRDRTDPIQGPGVDPDVALMGRDGWPDLSRHRVALVGGMRNVRAKVKAILEEHCKPRAVVEVEPSWDRNLHQADVDRYLHGATMVVVITGAVTHKTTNTVANWERRQRIIHG